jgi:hypothetical protein
LSTKNYQTLYSLNSLDFVLLIVPIEPAFMLAVASDRDLFMDAWNRNVLLVSPSTLLFVVRTVAHLWRQEAQSRNAQEIAKRGAELYDKFVGFVEDMIPSAIVSNKHRATTRRPMGNSPAAVATWWAGPEAQVVGTQALQGLGSHLG